MAMDLFDIYKQQKKRMKKRKKAGVCMYCPNKRVKNKLSCKKCSEKNNQDQKIRNKEFKKWLKRNEKKKT